MLGSAEASTNNNAESVNKETTLIRCWWQGGQLTKSGLLVGLLILTIVGYIPYLGGLVRLGVVCLGLGAFARQLYRASRPVITA
jgi:hypothetical protein